VNRAADFNSKADQAILTGLKYMDIADAKVSLRNPRKPELAPVEVEALADFCAVHLCIPEHIRIQLKLDEIDKKEVTLADGTKKLVPYVGPIELRFPQDPVDKNRVGFAPPKAGWSWVIRLYLVPFRWKIWI
jgi:hypothetical protein